MASASTPPLSAQSGFVVFPTIASAHADADYIQPGGEPHLSASFSSNGVPRDKTRVTLTATGADGDVSVTTLLTDADGTVATRINSIAYTTTYRFDMDATDTASAATASVQVKVGTTSCPGPTLSGSGSVAPGRAVTLTFTRLCGGSIWPATVRLWANGAPTGAIGTVDDDAHVNFVVRPTVTTVYTAMVERYEFHDGAAASFTQVVDGKPLVASTMAVTSSTKLLVTGQSAMLTATVQSGGRPVAGGTVSVVAGGRTVVTGKTSAAGAVSLVVKPSATTTYFLVFTPANAAAASGHTVSAASPAVVARRSVPVRHPVPPKHIVPPKLVVPPKVPVAAPTMGGSSSSTTVEVDGPAPVNLNFAAGQTVPGEPGTATTATASVTRNGVPLINMPVTIEDTRTGATVADTTTDSDGNVAVTVAPTATTFYRATVEDTGTTIGTSADTAVWVLENGNHQSAVDFTNFQDGQLSSFPGVKVVLDSATVDNGGRGYTHAAVWHGHIAASGPWGQVFDSTNFVGTPVTINIPLGQVLFFEQMTNRGQNTWEAGPEFTAQMLGWITAGSPTYLPGTVLSLKGHVYGDTSGLTVDVADGGDASNDRGNWPWGTPVITALLPRANNVPLTFDDAWCLRYETPCTP
ncbi:hypothetical protein SAMN05444157_1339 [Frankineae bacterium MT45]|nr:hypothetical protein SAMN05444157_1339 [Frankineae bacterium MT45]